MKEKKRDASFEKNRIVDTLHPVPNSILIVVVRDKFIDSAS